MSEQWRVGRHQPRNVYRGDEFVAVMVGEDEWAYALAEQIVQAMNEQESREFWPDPGE